MGCSSLCGHRNPARVITERHITYLQLHIIHKITFKKANESSSAGAGCTNANKGWLVILFQASPFTLGLVVRSVDSAVHRIVIFSNFNTWPV